MFSLFCYKYISHIMLYKGYTITHTQTKQSADMVSTKYLVPEKGGFAKQLAIYINKVKNQLDMF